MPETPALPPRLVSDLLVAVLAIKPDMMNVLHDLATCDTAQAIQHVLDNVCEGQYGKKPPAVQRCTAVGIRGRMGTKETTRKVGDPMVPVNAVADYVLSRVDVDKGESITNLKLQKLLYYVQAWHVVAHDGEPMFRDAIQAWPHGPVVYAAWKRFSGYGWHAIDTVADVDRDRVAAIPETEAAAIDQVLESYAHLSAAELEDLTHNEGPWVAARVGLAPDAPSNREIPLAQMREFYSAQQ